MKSFFRYVLVAITLLTAIGRAEAQVSGPFGLFATNSASSLQTGSAVAYGIFVTNVSGANLADAWVTNTFTGPALLLTATNIYGPIYTNSATNTIVFDLGQFVNGGVDLLPLTVGATNAGTITDTITFAAFNFTNIISTNLVTLATNALTTADLAVGVAGPAQGVIDYDLITYTANVTNYGPQSVTNVLLTNSLPPEVALLGGSPSQQYNLVTNSSVTNLVFNIGTIAAGGSYQLQLFLEPTNFLDASNPTTTLNFTTSVGAPDLNDPNITNNYASTNILVQLYLASLAASITNQGVIDPQTGLTEQFISISNTNGFSVPAGRVVVTGLTNQLYNAVGTNSGYPFVYYSGFLPPGRTRTMLLQFNPRVASLSTNEQLHAFGLPFFPNWTPPPAISNSASINISQCVYLTNGVMSGHYLVGFSATKGKSYTIVYSDNPSFSNAMLAPPSIVAPANFVQWIDYGPPTTAPFNGSMRLYRILANP